MASLSFFQLYEKISRPLETSIYSSSDSDDCPNSLLGPSLKPHTFLRL